MKKKKSTLLVPPPPKKKGVFRVAWRVDGVSRIVNLSKVATRAKDDSCWDTLDSALRA